MVSEIVRKISIDLIIDTPNDIITWFNDLWSRIHIIETDVYHKDGDEFIYYIINNDGTKQWLFYQNNKSDVFSCETQIYWSVLSSKGIFRYFDIQYVTKLLVENALNNNVTTPNKSIDVISPLVDNSFNSRIPTPYNYNRKNHINVEIALKNINLKKSWKTN